MFLFYLLALLGDALVLIDEADVFLEARNSTEIARNALGKIMFESSCFASFIVFEFAQLNFFLSFQVCVMLRLLEYYSGCLFLSSNRSAGSIGKSNNKIRPHFLIAELLSPNILFVSLIRNHLL